MRWVAVVLGLVVLAGSGYAQQSEAYFSVSYDGTSVITAAGKHQQPGMS